MFLRLCPLVGFVIGCVVPRAVLPERKCVSEWGDQPAGYMKRKSMQDMCDPPVCRNKMEHPRKIKYNYLVVYVFIAF